MCEHENLKKTDYFFEDGGYLAEYNVYCIDCGVKVGIWAYGNYYEEEQEKINENIKSSNGSII